MAIWYKDYVIKSTLWLKNVDTSKVVILNTNVMESSQISFQLNIGK